MGKAKEIRKDPLVFMKDGQEWTNSLDVAQKFGRRHDTVLRAINNLEKDCSESFYLLNFAEIFYVDSMNRNQKMYEMTRDGFSLLSMGFTGKKAIAWKIKYIEAFNKMERQIFRNARQAEKRAKAEWLETRVEGVRIRKEVTESIKGLVDVAKAQGSENASQYYPNFTKLIYRNMFENYLGGKGKLPYNFRDLLDLRQLSLLQFFEGLAEKIVAEEVEKGTDYHEIYQVVKTKIEAISAISGKTECPAIPAPLVTRIGGVT